MHAVEIQAQINNVGKMGNKYFVDGCTQGPSGGDGCRQVGGLPVSMSCRLKGTDRGVWTLTVAQALDTFPLTCMTHITHNEVFQLR